MRNPIRPHPQCTASKARASAAGTSRHRVDARELQPLHAQNFPSRAPQVNDATAAATVPNGGYERGPSWMSRLCPAMIVKDWQAGAQRIQDASKKDHTPEQPIRREATALPRAEASAHSGLGERALGR